MLIREIFPTNLLSFGPDTRPLELGPLNVLIGPNGSGKSNLIEVISLLQAAPKDLTAPIGEGGGIDEWLWKGEGVQHASVLVTLAELESTRRIYHDFEMKGEGRSFLVTSERIEISEVDDGSRGRLLYGDEGRRLVPTKAGDEALSWNSRFDTGQSVLAQLKLFSLIPSSLRANEPDALVRLLDLARYYEKIRIYRNWSFGRLSPVREFNRADLSPAFLSEDLKNLGLVLNQLGKQHEAKQRLLELLNDLYPGITDYEIIESVGRFQLCLKEGDRSIPAMRLSDGTLRYLALLAILCHPEPPPLICIEEPELGLHPDALLAIAKLIEEASERTQLIITTHSQFLVDFFTHDPEAIVVCEKGDRGTTMRRLKAEELEVWLKEYSLGNLWSSGQIGGNRW